MSVLPGGRPLRQALPDLDDLLADPRAYLSEGALAIGPRRVLGLAALFGLPGLALLASGLATVLGVGLLLGGLFWLAWSLRLRGHEIVLRPDGVEVNFRGTTVWAPWALFNVDDALVPATSRAGLLLPVRPEAVAHVELRRDGAPLALGLAVRGPQWAFTPFAEVVLPARYEVRSDELGALLLLLGRRLGGHPPRSRPPAPPGAVEARPGPDDWITVPATSFRLPPSWQAAVDKE
jgi:hypothetical protein